MLMDHPTLRYHAKPLLALGVTFVVTLPFLVCVTYVVIPTIHACYLLSKFRELDVGHATYLDAQILARQIRAVPSKTCDQSACEWDVRMDNARLPHWWRGSGETFVVSFTVKDEVVTRKLVVFGTGLATDIVSPSSASLQVQEDWGRTHRREPLSSDWYATDLFPYYRFVAYITPKASAEDKRLYTDFNLYCLWKYQGCEDARELLPVASSFSPPRQPQ